MKLTAVAGMFDRSLTMLHEKTRRPRKLKKWHVHPYFCNIHPGMLIPLLGDGKKMLCQVFAKEKPSFSLFILLLLLGS